jgi:antitoxin component YwqK of YwqJK toxin-antitoxin module
VKFYYPNGKVSSKGHTQMDIMAKDVHWYYSGRWMYYNEHGRLTATKTFEKGTEIAGKHVPRKKINFLSFMER